MKITKAYLDGAEYSLVDSSVVNHSNIVTVLIGKNGTGKSRMLANIVELFKISQEYSQNHPKLKSNRVSRLEFENDGEVINVFTGRGRNSRLLIENNKRVKLASPKKIIAASTSPFDKFPTLFSKAPDIYSYIGFKIPTGGLSDKQLMNTFVQSLLDHSPKPAVLRTLKLLGYEPKIKITFSHELRNLYNKNGRERFNNISEWLARDNKVHRIALHEQGGGLNQRIVKALVEQDAYQSQDSTKILGPGRLFRAVKSEMNVDNNVSEARLPKHFTFGQDVKSSVKSNLKHSLRQGLSRVDTIILKKTSGGSFNINESSSGERSLLLLICSIANEIKNNSLICIDEPEISLHPEWQEQFIQLISEVFKTYRNCHFLIATHSPLIISKLKTKSCFVLDLDHNELLNSEMFKSKSADYQLARLFNTPGEQNEYLKRLCVNVLAALSKGKKLTDDYRSDAEFLITYQEKLLPEDTVYQLIEIIKNALEVIGES